MDDGQPQEVGPVFSIPTFMGVGDDFDKKRVSDQRTAGANFMTNPGKKGLGVDCTIGEYVSIHAGDPYINPGTLERLWAKEKRTKRVVAEGFRYSSPAKKSAGSGDYFGTFYTVPLPHETEYIVPHKGDSVVRRQPLQRPIYTNPGKKGMFGLPGTQMSGDQMTYVADPEEFKRERTRKERDSSKAKMRGEPWSVRGTIGGCFDETAGTGASAVYTMTKPMMPRKAKQMTIPKGPEAPWRPAGVIPPEYAVLEYREDPYDGYDPRNPPMGREARAKAAAANDRPSWKPAAQKTSWYTKSIAFARL